MVPKVEACAQAVRRGVVRATSSTVAFPTRSSSSCSPTGCGHDGRAMTDRRFLMGRTQPPVTFVRGEGSVLFDAEGRSYLDFIGAWR